jgi:hypothetical protein
MNRTVYLLVGAAVAVLIVVLTAFGVWPGWVGVLVAGLLCAALILAVRFFQPAPLPPAATYAPAPVAPPPPPPPLTIQGVPLPSADPDYRFLLYGTVCWRFRPDGPDKRHPHPEELAKRIVIERAAQITAGEQPGGYDLVQHRLNNVLAVVTPDRTGSIEVWANNVSLTLPNEDMERQYRLSTVRKNEQVWEHERKYERNMRSYLRNEVLGDTGSTVVWWLARDPKQVQETVALIGPLAQLSAAANNRDVDPIFRQLTNGLPAPAHEPFDSSIIRSEPPPAGRDDMAAASAQTLADALFPNTEPERSRFADQLARLIAASGDTEIADRLRRTFDVPDFDVPDFGVPEPGASEAGAVEPDAAEPGAPRHHAPDPDSARSAHDGWSDPGSTDDSYAGAGNGEGTGPTGSAHDFEPFWPTTPEGR